MGKFYWIKILIKRFIPIKKILSTSSWEQKARFSGSKTLKMDFWIKTDIYFKQYNFTGFAKQFL